MVGAALWVVMSRYSRSSMEEHPDNSRAAEMARQARRSLLHQYTAFLWRPVLHTELLADQYDLHMGMV